VHIDVLIVGIKCARHTWSVPSQQVHYSLTNSCCNNYYSNPIALCRLSMIGGNWCNRIIIDEFAELYC